MDLGGIGTELFTYGPLGAFCAYLIWQRWEDGKREKERQASDNLIRKERIEADKELAKAMTLLAERIRHVPGV